MVPGRVEHEAGAPTDRVSDDALDALFARHEDRAHTVNVRLSIPVFRWRFYLVMLGGRELRHAERRARDRSRYPLLTLGNVLFLAWFVFAVYAFVLIVSVAVQGMLGG
ncbi:hypothetical protein F1188_08555 [Roseospira marina]|uniref:Uncharacterized protein n=1 Tax=Roseospira marina TaxID=140057 RepID=A0A5M6IDA8_9PROT|nr:hypothetical protein [Roseospira marina]KAA5606052.1 hypothetical protein F1188_08555 [Roseospira marina]MBB4313087.1 hypothetical protein [Roseospira marina]